MKKFLFSHSAIDGNKEVYTKGPVNRFSKRHNTGIFLFIVLGAVLFAGCKKNETNECKGLTDFAEFQVSCKGLSQQTLCELLQARLATDKYRNLSKALEDGYADISVVLPNMGYHYMKSAFVDSTFDISHPEILVYNQNHDSSFQLVAVEYAVPISLSPNHPPEGFTGSTDVWDYNTHFGLWLLHAWVWQSNPSGVFNPTNPGVHVH